MAANSSHGVAAEIVNADMTFTFDEMCLSCGVDADWVVELVEHGVIVPAGQSRSDWQFTSVSLVRIAKAKRLGRDLALNPPGVALALDLLDEIDRLRARLAAVQRDFR